MFIVFYAAIPEDVAVDEREISMVGGQVRVF